MGRTRNLVLLAVLLVCVASFWWARRDGEPSPEAAPPAESAAPALPRRTVAVAVLNGTSVPGLARRVSRSLGPHGCVAVTVADAPHDTFSRSLLVNRRLADDEARALAARLGDPHVLREWDPRGDEDVVLVLGRDHARIVRRLDGSP